MKKIKLLILGKSNVGKSSLINFFTNNHNCLVSSKIHATRISTYYLFNIDNYQIQIIDTPGTSIVDKNLLSQAMKSHAYKHLTDSDLIILLTQPQHSYECELRILNDILEARKPYMICVNKIDTDINKEFQLSLEKSLCVNNYSLISLKEHTGLDVFINDLLVKLESLNSFDTHHINKKNDVYVIQELIRESIVNSTSNELPYETAVRLIKCKKQKFVDIVDAEIIVSKENHKKIILGKNGSMIKKIGIISREKLQSLMKRKVHISLFVVVKENWKNNPDLLKDFGYIE